MERLRLPAHVWLYGLVGGLLIAALKYLEYRWLLVQHSVEIYGAIVAALFATLGIWLGRRLIRPETTVVVREVEVPVPVHVPVPVAVPAAEGFVRDEAQVTALGLTPRELEILGLIADGLSTREMAERLFVSENTVKTHTSRVLDKLDARRRTQAVQRARDLRLVP